MKKEETKKTDEKEKVIQDETVKKEINEVEENNLKEMDNDKENEISIEKKLESANALVEENKVKWLRTLAEFENFRKRSNQEKTDWIKNATKDVILELCDVMDNFERALDAVPTNEESLPFVKGVELIFSQLKNIAKKRGTEKIEALGKDFDPELHEALAHIPSEYEENKIAVVIKNGYTMNNKVIRHAQVAVSSSQIQDKEE